ncbi:MAG: biotin synthase BioB [Candidatus Margulisbacteria bacterium]|nr:biotin synthase BioB [Candidatus Margulisiibacteriota bacterium]
MNFSRLSTSVIKGKHLTSEEALELIKTSDDDTFELIAAANKVRRAKKGNQIKLCAIVNARSGKCSENCSFCAQSAHHNTSVDIYPLMQSEQIVEAARQAEKEMNATCFSIVTSGKGIIRDGDIYTLQAALKSIAGESRLNRCVSLGMVSKEHLNILKEAGLSNFHHNLETSRSHFEKICTTHSYDDRIKAVKMAKEAGLKVCSGGIFNVGESLEQRIELAMTLKELDVDQVPINILHPVAGTPAAKDHHAISPFEVLRLIAAYRFVLPDKDIGLFGGRESSLGQLQPLMFIAGANVTLIGNYLTVKGQSAQKDLEMIQSIGLDVQTNAGQT